MVIFQPYEFKLWNLDPDKKVLVIGHGKSYKDYEFIRNFKGLLLSVDATTPDLLNADFISDFRLLLENKGHSSSKISAMIKAFTTKLTSTATRSIDFRHQIYDWLSAQGQYKLPISFGGFKLDLTKDGYKFFSNNIIEYSFALKSSTGVITSQEQAIRALNGMQDLIKGIFDFIKKLSIESGGSKLIFYPFTPTPNGYSIVPSKIGQGTSLYPTNAELLEIQGELYPEEWNGLLNEWQITARSTDRTGLIYDPTNPSVFEDLVPYFLSLLLIQRSAFVVRIFDSENPMENNEGYFAFDISGAIKFSQLTKVPTGTGSSPPSDIHWSGGLESDYAQWNIFAELNSLIQKFRSLPFSIVKDKFHQMFDIKFTFNGISLARTILDYNW